MIIEQTVEIPADHRLTIEVPHEVPAGPVILTFSPTGVDQKGFPVSGRAKKHLQLAEDFDEIENVRLLLQKEMAEKGTSAVATAAGDGWEAHVRERYGDCREKYNPVQS
jgi:hypothetical protein